MTSGVRRFSFSRAVVPLEIRFVLMELNADNPPLGIWEMPGGQQNLAANPASVYQERSRRILEPGVRHHEGARRIGVLALVEPHHLTAELLIFRKRFPNVDRRADAGQREHTSDRFAMH